MASASRSSGEAVRVCVRIRPLNSKEKQDGRQLAVFADTARGEISLANPEADDREPPKKFTFDAAIPPEASQGDVYARAAFDIVESVVKGFNGTIFAYGQTGAGKSHTMEGYADVPEERGIIPSSFRHLFERIAAEGDKNSRFMVFASYLEIYNEEIRDLLANDPKNKLELKETADAGVFVKDLTARQVTGEAEMDAVLQQGKKNRSVGATLMNQTSSRSHSMFCITVEACSTTNGPSKDGKEHISVGKLNLVDLAGSERQAKTGATGDRMKEATKINLSLSALGNVISALVDGKSQHIPYRDSKLTRLLQDSLGGNAKTVMIANCGPADYNYNETLSTLRYANRAKNIKNKPKINEDPKDAKIREYQDKIRELREALAAQEERVNGGGAGGGGFVGGPGGGGGSRPIIGPIVPAEPKIVEKIVEKTVVKREGVSEEVLRALEEDARREKLALKQRAQAEMKVLLAEQSRTEEERLALEKELEERERQKQQLAKQKLDMVAQLAELEKQFIAGGQGAIDEAAHQERELREAQRKIEAQKRQEMMLARELAEKEDSNVLLEEQHASLQEEVDDKTRKLKKLWAKHKAAVTEIEDLTQEFQAEKEDVLDTLRALTRQLKLKHALLRHFIPPEEAAAIEKRATYDPETDEWRLAPPTNAASNGLTAMLRPKRPVSRRGARRIESEFARRSRLVDPGNPRWRRDNVVQLDMEMPERRTKDFEPSGGYGGGYGASGGGVPLAMNFWLDRVGITDESLELVFENEVDKSSSTADSPSVNAIPSRKKEKEASGGSSSASSETREAERAPPTREKSSRKSSSSSTSQASSTSSTVSASSTSSSTSTKRPPTARFVQDITGFVSTRLMRIMFLIAVAAAVTQLVSS